MSGVRREKLAICKDFTSVKEQLTRPEKSDLS